MVMAINTVAFIILHAYIMRNLIKPDLPAMQDPRIILKSFVGPSSYLLGALAAWYHPALAFGFYMITPLFFITPVTALKPAG
jgi:hypothetical protein